MSGTTAGEAYDLTLRDLATRLPDDLRAPSTLDAFQLIGDRHLAWPVLFPASDVEPGGGPHSGVGLPG